MHCAGQPQPLGPSKQNGCVNFAIYAKYAKVVTLHLFTKDNKFITQVEVTNRTGEWAALQSAALCQSERPRASEMASLTPTRKDVARAARYLQAHR